MKAIEEWIVKIFIRRFPSNINRIPYSDRSMYYLYESHRTKDAIDAFLKAHGIAHLYFRLKILYIRHKAMESFLKWRSN